MKKERNYTSAPLPFQGQKRNFLKHFKQALADFPADAIYVDLFGGSGLLSRTVKDTHPQATVIYNDYDNYRGRLALVDTTNEILGKLRELLKNHERGKIIKEPYRTKIFQLLRYYGDSVDWITISSSLLFSMKYVLSLEELESSTLYNKVRKTNYPMAKDYLQGINVVSNDYRGLFCEFKDVSNVVFLVDPPYLSTDSKTYASDKFWKLKDYLNVLDTVNKHSFFYFTSDKSAIVELCEWLDENGKESPFKDATRVDINASVSHNAKYTDIMLFKTTLNAE